MNAVTIAFAIGLASVLAAGPATAAPDCASELQAVKAKAFQLPSKMGYRKKALNFLAKAEDALAAGQEKKCLNLVRKADEAVLAGGG